MYSNWLVPFTNKLALLRCLNCNSVQQRKYRYSVWVWRLSPRVGFKCFCTLLSAGWRCQEEGSSKNIWSLQGPYDAALVLSLVCCYNNLVLSSCNRFDWETIIHMLIDLFRVQCTRLYMCTGTDGGSQSRGKKDENVHESRKPSNVSSTNHLAWFWDTCYISTI